MSARRHGVWSPRLIGVSEVNWEKLVETDPADCQAEKAAPNSGCAAEPHLAGVAF